MEVAWLPFALDPRFKTLGFLSEEQWQTVWKCLKEKLSQVQKPRATDTSSSPAEEESVEDYIGAMTFLMGVSTAPSVTDIRSTKIAGY